MSPGARLKAWREREELSQKQAGDLVGVCQPTWSDWESDKKLPRIQAAGRIARVTRGKCPIEMWLRSEAA